MDLYQKATKHFGSVRPEQERLFNDIVGNKGLKVSAFNAATGIGKTLAYCLGVLSDSKPTVIAVPNFQLADQVLNTLETLKKSGIGEDRTVSLRMGIREYLSPGRVVRLYKLYYPDADPANKALWDALLDAADSDGTDNLISSYMNEYERLPNQCGRNDVCCTSEHRDSKLLMMSREGELESDIIVISHVTLITSGGFKSLPDKFKGARLVVDEADSIVQLADTIYSQSISKRSFSLKAQSLENAELAGLIHEFIDIIEELPQGLHYMQKEAGIWLRLTSIAEELALELGDDPFVDQLYRFCELGITNSSVSRTPKAFSIIQLSNFAASVMKFRIEDMSETWLLSGTLEVTKVRKTQMIWLARQFQIEPVVGFYGFYEPDQYGHIEFSLIDKDGVRPFNSADISPEYISQTVSLIPDETTLVAASSHEEVKLLSRALKLRGKHVVVEDKNGSRLQDNIDRFVQAKTPAVLVTCRAGTGTDIRSQDGSQLFHNLVITRLPYARPFDDGDVEWRASERGIEPDTLRRILYANGLQKSLRRFIQTIGRAIRSENDRCKVIIADPRMPRVSDTSGSVMFRDCIPTRFLGSYAKADTKSHKNGASKVQRMII